MPPYIIGQTIDLTATFVDPDTLASFDPIGVVFKVLSPHSSVIQTPTPIRDSTGAYHATVVVDSPGNWWWRVETTGPVGAAERMFPVNFSNFTGS